MTKLARLLGQLVLVLLGLSVLTTAALFIAAAYLTTFPLLRISPRNRKLKALLEFSMAVAALAAAYQPESPERAPNDT